MAYPRSTFDPFGEVRRKQQSRLAAIMAQLDEIDRMDQVAKSGGVGGFKVLEDLQSKRDAERTSRMAAVQEALKPKHSALDDIQDAVPLGVANIFQSNADVARYDEAKNKADLASIHQSLSPQEIDDLYARTHPVSASRLAKAEKSESRAEEIRKNNYVSTTMTPEEVQKQGWLGNLGDSRFWSNYLLPTGPLSVADLPKSLIAGAIGGMAGGGGSVAAASLVGADSEAKRDAADKYVQLLREGKSSQEALLKANELYNTEVGALTALNVPEMLALLTPVGKVAKAVGKVASKASKVTSKLDDAAGLGGKVARTAASVGGKGAVVGAKVVPAMFSEGSTELFQNVAATRADEDKPIMSLETYKEAGAKLLDPDKRTAEDEMALRLGAMMGGGMGAMSAAGGLVKDYAAKRRDQQDIQGGGPQGYEGDRLEPTAAPRIEQVNPQLLETYQHQVLEALSPQDKTIFRQTIINQLDMGMEETEAVYAAMDTLMEKEATRVAVENAFARVNEADQEAQALAAEPTMGTTQDLQGGMPQAAETTMETTQESMPPVGSKTGALTVRGQAKLAEGSLEEAGVSRQGLPGPMRVKSGLQAAAPTEMPVEMAGASMEATEPVQDILPSGPIESPIETIVERPISGGGLSGAQSQISVSEPGKISVSTTKQDGEYVHTVTDGSGRVRFQSKGYAGRQIATQVKQSLQAVGKYIQAGGTDFHIADVSFDENGRAQYHLINTKTGEVEVTPLTQAELKKGNPSAAPVTMEGRTYASQATVEPVRESGQDDRVPEAGRDAGERDSRNDTEPGNRGGQAETATAVSETGETSQVKESNKETNAEGRSHVKAMVDVHRKSDPNFSATYVPPSMLRAQHQMLVELGKHLGIEVRFFDSNDDAVVEFVPRGSNGLVYIRRGGSVGDGRTELWALGHGFIHNLKVQHNDLYKELEATLKKMIRSPQKARYLGLLSPKYAELVAKNSDLLIEEILGDEGGNFFVSERFLSALQDENKGLYDKLVEVIRKLIRNLRGWVEQGTRVDNTLTPRQVDKLEGQIERILDQVAQRTYNESTSQESSPLGTDETIGQDSGSSEAGTSILDDLIGDDVETVFSSRIDSITKREDGLNVATGQVITSTGRGESIEILFPDRNFKIFDQKALDGFLQIVNSVDDKSRRKAFGFAMGTNKLEDQPIIQLSSGCFRAGAILQAIQAGLAPKKTLKLVAPCHMACYKNYDQAATTGASPWSGLIGQARKDYAKGNEASEAFKYLSNTAQALFGITFEWKDVPKPGSGDSAAFNQLKNAFGSSSTERRGEIYQKLVDDGWHKPWQPQEVKVPTIVSPEDATELVNSISEGQWNKIRQSKASFIRGNQQGDWFPELATGSWQAYAEAMFAQMDKRGIDKKISCVTTGWYLPIADEVLRDVADRFGDRIIVQLTGPIDFDPWEADLRLEGFKRLQDAGLKPIMRLVTDEFGQGGHRLNHVEAIKKTLSFIIENKIPPRFILETPFHIDAAGFGATTPTALVALAKRTQDLFYVTQDESVYLAALILLRNNIFNQYRLTDVAARDKKGNIKTDKNGMPEMVKDRFGHEQVGLTYERLKAIGIPDSTLNKLKKLGYLYKFNRLNPETGQNEPQEGVFPAQCCTTGKCLNCGQCALNSSSLIKTAKKHGYTKAMEMYLKKIPPEQAAYFLNEINQGPLFSARRKTPTPASTTTPEFRKWFSGSKVVDSDGKPLKVYHGTAIGGFTEFSPENISLSERTSQQGPGFYFTDNEKWAKEYLLKENDRGKFVKSDKAQMFEVYLAIKNPLDVTQNKRTITDAQIRKIIQQGAEWSTGWWKRYYTREKAISDREVHDRFIAEMKNKGDKSIVQKLVKWFQNPEKLVKAIKEATGHDGIVDNFRGQGNIYVAFSPTQIKSVYNEGTWDENNPDIRFSSRRKAPYDHLLMPKGLIFGKKPGGAFEEDKWFIWDTNSGVSYGMGDTVDEAYENAGLNRKTDHGHQWDPRSSMTRAEREEFSMKNWTPPSPSIRYEQPDPEDVEAAEGDTLFSARTKEMTSTDTQEFRRWFRESQVSYEDGTPAIMYHGSNTQINKFTSPNALGDMYFSADPRFAHRYARNAAGSRGGDPTVMQVYLSVQRPFDYANQAEVSEVYTTVAKRYKEDKAFAARVDRFHGGLAFVQSTIFDTLKGDWYAIEAWPVLDTIKKMGYDGFLVIEDDALNIGVFEASQIKSVFNDGTWNPKDGDIRFSARRKPANQKTPGFAEFMKDNKAVDKNGAPVKLYHGSTKTFDEFDLSHSRIFSDMGIGVYMTNNVDDVGGNYATSLSHDFQYKLDQLVDEYLEYGLEDGREVEDEEEARYHAHQRLVDHQGVVLPLYVRMTKPFVIGGDNPTTWTYETDTGGNLFGEVAEFIERLQGSAEYYQVPMRVVDEIPVEVADLLSYQTDAELDEPNLSFPVLAGKLFEEVKEYSGIIDYTVDENGAHAGGEALRGALEDMGYDGIIDYSVSRKFRFLSGMKEGTAHYIAFRPEQVKSQFNDGTWSQDTPKILFSARSMVEDREPVPTFYSRLRRVIETKMPKQAPVADIRGIIRSGQIKAEEIKWSGVLDFLDAWRGKEKVPKDLLLEHLDAVQVEVEETTKTSDSGEMETGVESTLENAFDIIVATGEGEARWERGRSFHLQDHDSEYISQEMMEDDFLAEAQLIRLNEIEINRELELDVEIAEINNLSDAIEYIKDWVSRGRAGSRAFRELPQTEDGLTLLWDDRPVTERDLNYLAASRPPTTKSVKFERYRTRKDLGGYQELLFRLATAGGMDRDRTLFWSSHWDESNVFAHARVSSGTTPDGKTVLYVQEIQSDWGLEADQKGIRGQAPVDLARAEEIRTELETASGSRATQLKSELKRIEDRLEAPDYTVNDAPFISRAYEYVLKRLLRYAAENNFDHLAWSTGKQQRDLYRLSKYISKVTYNPATQRFEAAVKGSRETIGPYMVPLDELEEYVGKDLALKIKAEAEQQSPLRDEESLPYADRTISLEDLELEVGGEGKNQLYDIMIPNFLKKYGKKWGVEVKDISIPNIRGGEGDRHYGWNTDDEVTFYVYDNETGARPLTGFNTYEEADAAAEKMNEEADPELAMMRRGSQPSIEITDAMKESVLYEGQPLFSARRKNRSLGDGTRSESFPTTVAEGGQVDEQSAKAVGAETERGGRATYTPIKLKALDEKALNRYQDDPDEAIRFLSGEFKPEEAPLATATARHLVLDLQQRAQQAEVAGNYAEAQRLRDSMVDTVMKTSERLRTYGQAISAARLFQNLDAASALLRAERLAKTQYERAPHSLRTEVEDLSVEVSQGLNAINTEALGGVMGSTEVRDALAGALEGVNRRRKRAADRAADERKQGPGRGGSDTPGRPRKKGEPNPAELLANRIRNRLAETKEKEVDPIKEMVNTLFSIARETLPKDAKNAPTNPIDMVIRAISARDEYQEVWMEAWDKAKGLLAERYGDFANVEDFLNFYLYQPYPVVLLRKAMNQHIKDAGIDLNEAIATGKTGEIRGRLIRALTADAELSRELGRELNISITREFDQMVADRTKQMQQRLAKGVIAMAEGKSSDPKAASDMMSTLMKIARQRIPKKESQPRNKLELVVEANKNKRLYRHIWEGAKREIIAQYGEDHPLVIQLKEFFETTIGTPYDVSQLEAGIRQGMKDEEIKMSDLVRRHYTVVDATGRSLADKLVEGMDLSEADASALARAIQGQLKTMTAQRKADILNNMVTKDAKSKEAQAKRKTLIDRICEYSNLGAFDHEATRRIIAEHFGLPVITDQMAATIVKLTDIIQTGDRAASDEACMLLDALLANIKRPSTLRKIATFQNISMLLNTKTTIRNMGGNVVFWVAERVSHLVATPIDWALSEMMPGRPRMVTFNTGGQWGFWEGFMKGAEAGWKGYTIRGLDTQFDIGYGLAFDPEGNPAERFFSFLERALRVTLQGFDYATYNLVYNQTLGEAAVLHLINSGQKVTKESVEKAMGNLDMSILEMADQAGKYATFQDDNVISRSLVNIKRSMNGGKDWGLGDMVLKFPKTPGALMMRGIEYSPAGFLRAYMVATQGNRPGKDGKPGKANDPREAVLAISRASIGTFGFTAFGFLMASLGIIMPSDPGDDDIRELRQAQGIGGDRINLTAFRRWSAALFTSKDAKKEAELRKGDLLVSYDWAQPLALSVAFGTGLYESLANKDLSTAKRTMAIPSAVGLGLASGVNTLVEQPLLQGIQRLFQPSYGDDGASHIAKVLVSVAGGVPASFIPTMFSQLRQLVDEDKRYMKEDDPVKYGMAQMANKVPGLSETLPVKHDTLGQPVKQYWNGTNNILNVMLNPAFVSRYKPSPEAELVLDLYKSSGSAAHFPHAVQRNIMVDGENRRLSAKQYQDLQRMTGTAVAARLRTIPPGISDEDKIERIEKILKEEGSRARKQLLRDNAIPE